MLATMHTIRRLDEGLHPTAKTQPQVHGGILLDVVVRQSAAILQLFAGKEQARGNSFLVLDLGLHAVYGVARLNPELCLKTGS